MPRMEVHLVVLELLFLPQSRLETHLNPMLHCEKEDLGHCDSGVDPAAVKYRSRMRTIMVPDERAEVYLRR